MPALCTHGDCRKRATWARFFAKPIYCKEHGLAAGAKLQYNVCRCGAAHPTFGEPGDSRASCCALCRTGIMEDLVNKRCQHSEGCRKQPAFGHPGDEARFCADHKSDDMENVVTKRCQHPEGCKKIPVFANPGSNVLFCAAHKQVGMQNIKHKRCQYSSGCTRRPNFGSPGGDAIFCAAHKCDGMEDLKTKRCRHPEGCKKHPTFGYSGGTPMFCADHKNVDMEDLKNKRCQHPSGCKTQSVFGNPGSEPLFCKAHMQIGMVDVKNPMCPGASGQKGPDGMCPLMKFGNRKYGYYCVECFCREFPADPRTAMARKKGKELVVRDFLFANFPELGLVHDLPLWTGGCDCTHRRRVDFRCMIAGVMLAIEVDEHQHKDRDRHDEEIRYDDLCMIHTGPWVFIRYNPDMYTDALGRRRNPHVDTRLATLKDVINEWVSSLRAGAVSFEDGLVKIVRLFCDEGSLSTSR